VPLASPCGGRCCIRPRTLHSVAPARQEVDYEPGSAAAPRGAEGQRGRPERQPKAELANALPAAIQPGAGVPTDGGARGACERGSAGAGASERPADRLAAGAAAEPAAADRRGAGPAAAGSAAQGAPQPARSPKGRAAAQELGRFDRRESEGGPAGGRRSRQEYAAPGAGTERSGRPCGRRAAAATADAEGPAACAAPGPAARAEPGSRPGREQASKRARVCA
jgi:hypothetical protein